MENIDDLMRQKFDSDDPGERFEFQEEYWEQAQVLLEQDEARRRRRFWLFIGLMLGVILFSWYVIVHWFSGSLSQNEGGAGDSTSSVVKTESKAGGNLVSDGSSIDSISIVGDTVSGNFQQHEKSSFSAVSENTSQSNGGINSNPGSRGALKENKAPDASKSEDAYLHELAANKSERSRVERKGDIKPDNAGNHLDKYRQHSQGNAETQISKSQKEVEALRQNQFKNGSENARVAGITLIDSLQRTTELPIKGEQVTIQPTLIQTEARQFMPIFMLPTPLTNIIWPARSFDLRKIATVSKEPIATLIKPAWQPRFSFGLSLAGAAYQPSDTGSRWAGWAIGVYGNYRMNKNLSLMLGIQERFVPGYGAPVDTANPDLKEQLRYSFGYVRETWQPETRGLHYLEIPISARWHKGRWGIEGGGATGMLFLVHNRTKRTIETSLEAPKTEIKKLVKGDIKPYNRTYFSAFAGAEYRLNNRLSLMARGQYRFTPVFKVVEGGVKNKGLGNVDFGVRLRLF